MTERKERGESFGSNEAEYIYGYIRSETYCVLSIKKLRKRFSCPDKRSYLPARDGLVGVY
jgi:hypothetical protein